MGHYIHMNGKKVPGVEQKCMKSKQASKVPKFVVFLTKAKEVLKFENKSQQNKRCHTVHFCAASVSIFNLSSEWILTSTTCVLCVMKFQNIDSCNLYICSNFVKQWIFFRVCLEHGSAPEGRPACSRTKSLGHKGNHMSRPHKLDFAFH